MTVPLLHKVTKFLVTRGLAVLRFNFRGVGLSEGSWDGGVGETDDVARAVDRASAEYDSLGLAGWSFGAVTALAWQALEGDGLPYAGIAPPVRTEYAERLPAPQELAPARRLFILGDRDQFATVHELREYSAAAGGSLSVLTGSDHFFYFREKRVADLMAEHFLNRPVEDV
jgi:alpha/beta superfamily hydrolase